MIFRSSEDGFFKRWRKEDYRQAFKHFLAFFFFFNSVHCLCTFLWKHLFEVLQCQWRHRIDSSGDSFCCLPTEQAQHRQHKLCWACLTNVPLAPVKKFRTSKRWCALQREAGWVLSCPLCPQPWHCCPPPSLTVQPTPGWVPGLSRTGAHSSHANSSFQQEPTSSLLKLVPGSLPEGSQDQQILRGAAPHSCSSLAVTADAGASEHEMEVCC